MSSDDQEVRQAVDRLLLEQGLYTPLELLLAEGRLLFADYERWRAGEVEWLDELLFGDPDQSRELLQQARGYAEALGLVAETLHYHPWGREGERLLRFSPQGTFDRLFHTRYCKPADQPQLDLFMDATGTSLVNGILAALGGRDYVEAERLLQGLFDSDPGNRQLGALEQLVTASGRLQGPLEDSAAELAWLRRELAPLAVDLLGVAARDYLAPFWRRLEQALEGQPFDPRRPDLHASYLALRRENWTRVLILVEAEVEWRAQPPLLHRHARACSRLQRPEQALADWCLLCWRFPDQAEAIGREAEPLWRACWDEFCGLEPELAEPAFPAWLLLRHPGLHARLERTGALAGLDPPEAFQLCGELASPTAAALPGEALIERRRRLREQDPALFTHYLRRFGGG